MKGNTTFTLQSKAPSTSQTLFSKEKEKKRTKTTPLFDAKEDIRLNNTAMKI